MATKKKKSAEKFLYGVAAKGQIVYGIDVAQFKNDEEAVRTLGEEYLDDNFGDAGKGVVYRLVPIAEVSPPEHKDFDIVWLNKLTPDQQVKK